MNTKPRMFSVTNHLVNPVLRPLLRGPFGRWFGRHLAVIRYTGRRTGTAYELVTQYARDGATVWIVPAALSSCASTSPLTRPHRHDRARIHDPSECQRCRMCVPVCASRAGSWPTVLCGPTP